MAATRRRLPRDQRRRTLIDAARRVVVQLGYGELTMERVAKQAGVSKTLVYDHFAHRRELYFAVLAEEQVKLVQRLAPPLSSHDREQRVRETVTAFLALVDEYGDGYTELFRNPIAHDPEIASELLRARDGVAEMIAGVLAHDVGADIAAVRLPAQAIVGAMETAADWLTRLPRAQRPPTAEVAAVLTRLIWQGLEGVEAMAGAETDSGPTLVPLRPSAKKAS